MKMPIRDGSNWIALWASIPETVKYTILAMFLSIVLAFKNDGRSLRDRITDVLATPIIVVMAGSGVEQLGASPFWTLAIGGVVAALGVAPLKTILYKYLDRWSDRRAEQ